MEFISTEEFLKQPKGIQKVFIDWWEPSEGDIYSYIDLGENCRECISQRIIQQFKRVCNKIKITLKEWLFKNYKHCIPLLTEGQLREFIENKTNKTLFIDFDCIEEKLDYDIYLFDNNDKYIKHENLGNSLFKAYWKVALEIAKENVENEYK